MLSRLPVLLTVCLLVPMKPRAAAPAVECDRSPIDLALTRDEKWLVTANHTSGTLSLVRLDTGAVAAEVPCGQRPAAVALTPDERTVLVSAAFSGELTLLSLDEGRLRPCGSVWLGFEPRGLAVSPDGKLAYVALTAADSVAVVDLTRRAEVARIPVGRWPRHLALSPDGKRLVVGVSGAGGVSVIDTAARKPLFLEDFMGLNLGQMQASRDGKYAYFPWISYGHNPITEQNIERGWVLASRIARVRLDRQARREAIALDPRGKAVGDPHGIALSPDEKRLVCAASGTHELLVYRLTDLPFQDYGGPGDHIDPDVLKDRDRFDRVELGGRPMAVRYLKDGRRAAVANYLRNSVQVVDVEARKVAREITLGGPEQPSLARRGEAIFFDARRSHDQWYSCHSCHYEGGPNAQAMDTRNDGRFGNFKTVPGLEGVSRTGPWFWHGNEKSLDNALGRSFTGTLLGKAPAADDVRAVRAYLDTLASPPGARHRDRDGRLSEQAARGEKVFAGEKAGCARCHPAPWFSDGKTHSVGTNDRGDVFTGYDTPSLKGVFRRVLLLHDGRAKSLEQLLRGPHAPEKVTRKGKLTEAELADLIAYLLAVSAGSPARSRPTQGDAHAPNRVDAGRGRRPGPGGRGLRPGQVQQEDRGRGRPDVRRPTGHRRQEALAGGLQEQGRGRGGGDLQPLPGGGGLRGPHHRPG
jgi:YVTN family beta-propeller protein